MRSKKGHMIKLHIIAPVATIAAVVEKRVSATVAIYGNTLFSDSGDKYDSGDERRWDRKISISATVATAATVHFVKWKPLKNLVATVATKMLPRVRFTQLEALNSFKTSLYEHLNLAKNSRSWSLSSCTSVWKVPNCGLFLKISRTQNRYFLTICCLFLLCCIAMRTRITPVWSWSLRSRSHLPAFWK